MVPTLARDSKGLKCPLQEMTKQQRFAMERLLEAVRRYMEKRYPIKKSKNDEELIVYNCKVSIRKSTGSESKLHRMPRLRPDLPGISESFHIVRPWHARGPRPRESDAITEQQS